MLCWCDWSGWLWITGPWVATGAVASALSDSERAINLFLKARISAAEADAALSNARAAFALSRQRADRGEDDRLALARARLAELAAERRASEAAAAKAQAAVALFKSLGGGWSQAG